MAFFGAIQIRHTLFVKIIFNIISKCHINVQNSCYSPALIIVKIKKNLHLSEIIQNAHRYIHFIALFMIWEKNLCVQLFNPEVIMCIKKLIPYK